MSTDCIDIHTHIVPENFPAYAGSGRDVPWPSMAEAQTCHRHVMISGKIYRTVSDGGWSVPRRIEAMGEMRVARQALSPMPELLSHWFPSGDADALCRYINEGIAELCAAHPRHFVGIGMVPMQDAALAARRLEEVKSLGLRGVEIGSHVNGMPLGDACLHAVYAAAEQAGLMVMIHPLHPLGLDRMGGRPELAAVAAFPLETAFAAVSLMTNSITERFPRLRILLSHGGGALPWILPRLRHAHSLGPPLNSLFSRDPGEMARTFYYDTILYGDVALGYLKTKVGKDRLVAGSDYPFVIKQDRPAEFAEAALGMARETFANNARSLLGLEAGSAVRGAS